MDTESQYIYDRMKLHRLMKAHPTWSSPQLAAAVGRCERWARKWMARFRAVKVPSFKMYKSHSRAPKTRPRQTNMVVKDAICEWRERLSEQYHCPAGAGLI